MKILTLNKSALCSSIILICLLATATGCFWKSEQIKTAKVSDPASVSTTCAQNAGLDEKDTAALVTAIKHYHGEMSDEFKLRAMTVITDSHSIDPSKKDSVTQEYLSCVANSAQKK